MLVLKCSSGSQLDHLLCDLYSGAAMGCLVERRKP